MGSQQNITLKQPKPFYVVFFVEMWERFGYYGLQALLILYLSKVFLFSDTKAYGTFAAFAALVYCTPFLGGYVGDKLIGYQRTLLVGATMLMLGYFMLAIPTSHMSAAMGEQLFYLALSMIAIGNGFFKTSPSSILARSYNNNDPRVDSGFTLFYMSVNIGSFISMLLCGYIAERFGWHIAFAICGMGLAIGIITFTRFRYILKGIGANTDHLPLNKKVILPIAVLTLMAVYVGSIMLRYLTISHWVLAGVAVAAVIFYGTLLVSCKAEERKKLLACVILTAMAIMFYCLYFQAPESVSLFVDRNVRHDFFGLYVPTASFQSLNPIWILALAPLLSLFYSYLQKDKRDLTLAMKFAVGIIIMGSGFIALNISQYYADNHAMVSPWWVVLSFFLYSLGELLVSALGPAMIARLVPRRYLGVMMGTWFLASAFAAYLSGEIATLASVPKHLSDPLSSLHIYTSVFAKFGWLSIAIGLLAVLMVPFINRMTGERVKSEPESLPLSQAKTTQESTPH